MTTPAADTVHPLVELLFFFWLIDNTSMYREVDLHYNLDRNARYVEQQDDGEEKINTKDDATATVRWQRRNMLYGNAGDCSKCGYKRMSEAKDALGG